MRALDELLAQFPDDEEAWFARAQLGVFRHARLSERPPGAPSRSARAGGGGQNRAARPVGYISSPQIF
jgi:hypothetical protein